MRSSMFANAPLGGSFHSNKYAAGTTTPQTFGERVNIEKNRTQIAKYRSSKLGDSAIDRQQLRVVNARAEPIHTQPPVESRARQSFNSREQARPVMQFKDAPARGYDPYS